MYVCILLQCSNCYDLTLAAQAWPTWRPACYTKRALSRECVGCTTPRRAKTHEQTTATVRPQAQQISCAAKTAQVWLPTAHATTTHTTWHVRLEVRRDPLLDSSAAACRRRRG